MGQAEVMRVLEKENKGLTAKQISKILKVSQVLVNRALLKLYNYGEVSKRRVRNYRGNVSYEYQLR